MDYRDPEWVAEKLGLERNTVYRFLQEGTIPAVQLGRKWLISEARLAQWLEEETDRQTASRRDAEQSTERTVRRMETFTAEAQAAIRAAHTAARGYNHHYLGREHLVLGFALAGECEAGKVLEALGMPLSEIRKEVESRTYVGDTTPPRRLGRTPNAKAAMRDAEAQSLAAGEKQVGSIRLLLGILRSGPGLGQDVLTQRGITADAVINMVQKREEGQ